MRLLTQAMWACVAFAAFWLAGPDAAWAQRRVALVIGNSVYKHATTLPNAKNDAVDISGVLKRLDFEL